MNITGVFLHVLADALGSVVVMISASVIAFTDWEYRDYLDPVLSLVIVFTTIDSIVIVMSGGGSGEWYSTQGFSSRGGPGFGDAMGSTGAASGSTARGSSGAGGPLADAGAGLFLGCPFQGPSGPTEF